MRAAIERGFSGISIGISGLPDMRNKTEHIYDSIVEHCSKDLSVNDLREVVRQINEQTATLDPDDIPPSHLAILRETKEVLRKREGKSQKFSAPVSTQLSMSWGNSTPTIDILGLSGKKTNDRDYVFPTLVEHCSEDLSTNELRQVVWDLEMQLADVALSGKQNPAYAALLKKAKESGMIEHLKTVILNRTGNKPKFSATMRTKIERKSAGGGLTISVVDLRKNYYGGNEMCIFNTIVEYCSKDFSVDELRQILWSLEREFSHRDPDDIPLSYAEIINEIRTVIRKRRDNDQTEPASS